jgi:hypothetical protein
MYLSCTEKRKKENMKLRGSFRKSALQINMQGGSHTIFSTGPLVFSSSSSSYSSTVQYGPWPPLMGFRNNGLFTGLDCYSSAQPPTWRTRSPYLWPPETECPSYTPRHWGPILVAFYDMYGLQWDYSLIPATTRDLVSSYVIEFGYTVFCADTASHWKQ